MAAATVAAPATAAAAAVTGGTTPAWPPPAPAGFENDYSDGGGRRVGGKGWLDGCETELQAVSIVLLGSVGC